MTSVPVSLDCAKISVISQPYGSLGMISVLFLLAHKFWPRFIQLVSTGFFTADPVNQNSCTQTEPTLLKVLITYGFSVRLKASTLRLWN